MVGESNLLWRVDGHGVVWVDVGELDALVPQLLVHLDDSLQVRLRGERVGPDLDQTQDFLLHGCRRVILRSDQLHQLLDELFVGDQDVKVFTAVLDASLQHCQRESAVDRIGVKKSSRSFRLILVTHRITV